MVIVLALIVGLFVLAGTGWLETQKAAFMLVVLLWPLTAILVKRLHDRNKSGGWALALVLAWMLGNGNWAMLPPLGQWGVGRFLPTLITVMMLLDCGAFGGTTGSNRFGPAAEPLRLRAS